MMLLLPPHSLWRHVAIVEVGFAFSFLGSTSRVNPWTDPFYTTSLSYSTIIKTCLPSPWKVEALTTDSVEHPATAICLGETWTMNRPYHHGCCSCMLLGGHKQ